MFYELTRSGDTIVNVISAKIFLGRDRAKSAPKCDVSINSIPYVRRSFLIDNPSGVYSHTWINRTVAGISPVMSRHSNIFSMVLS